MRSAVFFGGRLPDRQRGVALVLGLMLLLVMTLLAVTASRSAILQERMAGNFRQASLAFHATEASGRWGGAWLQSLGASTGIPRPFPCTSACKAIAGTAVWVSGQYTPAFDWSANGWSFGQNPTDAAVIKGFESSVVDATMMVSAPPKFVLEEYYFQRDDLSLSTAAGVVYYRVIAYGTGQRANTARVITSLVAKRFK